MLVAANRDEHYDRPSAAPQILSGSAKILAGRDLRAGGTWLGVNEHGLVVGILNRRLNGAEPARAKARSRGLLCMDLLARKSAGDGRAFIAGHNQQYNPFTLMFADRDAAFIAYNVGPKLISGPLDSGLHVFSSAAEVDVQSVKADRARKNLPAHRLASIRLAPALSIGFRPYKKCYPTMSSIAAPTIPPTPSVCTARVRVPSPPALLPIRDRHPPLKCFTALARPAATLSARL